MRHRSLHLVLLISSVPLAACRDELPTAAGLRGPPSVPRRALVSGPVTPTDGGTVSSTVLTVANLELGYSQPRVSGDLACYTDHTAGVVRSYRFSTNASAPIDAQSSPNHDFDCAIESNHVAFVTTGAATAPGVYDVTTLAVTRIGPQLTPPPRYPAVGGSTLSYVELRADFLASKIRVADLSSPGVSTVLSDVGLFEDYPNVSPNGNVVVWERVQVGPVTNYVVKATRDPGTGAWSAPQVVTSYAGGVIPGPDTDGSYIVWMAPSGIGGERDIFVQAVSGGPIMQVAIPGYEAEPRIDAGVMAFRHVSATGTNPEILAYVIATNTLYHVSPAAGFLTNFRDLDVSVLSNGDVRVVWQRNDQSVVDDIIYASTFSVAGNPGPVFTFGGFQPPLAGGSATVTAPAVVPVKFSLGGNFGLSIFAANSPSSAPANCNTGAVTGASSPTVAQYPLDYDTSTGSYIYKWKTDVAWKNTCRVLTLTFTDGTVATARVQFR